MDLDYLRMIFNIVYRDVVNLKRMLDNILIHTPELRSVKYSDIYPPQCRDCGKSDNVQRVEEAYLIPTKKDERE